MPLITLCFNEPLNVSVQANPAATTASPQGADMAYWAATPNVGVHPTAPLSNVFLIGPIVSITPWNGFNACITCNMSAANFANPGPPPLGAFIMFSKDNKANLSSILGYYAELEFRNDSKDEAELFGVGVGYTESSK